MPIYIREQYIWSTNECERIQYPSTENRLQLMYAFGILLKQLQNISNPRKYCKTCWKVKVSGQPQSYRSSNIIESIAGVKHVLGDSKLALQQYTNVLAQELDEAEESIFKRKAHIYTLKEYEDYEGSETLFNNILERRLGYWETITLIP